MMKQRSRNSFADRLSILAAALGVALALPACAATGPILSLTPGVVTTYAGTLSNGGGGTVGNGGPANAANLYLPYASRFDAAGNLYILDAGNAIIRKVNASGTIASFAFSGTPGNSGDGAPASAAQLGASARGLFVTAAGVVYVSDSANGAVRIIDLTGKISTVAGTNGTSGFGGDGGMAAKALLSNPGGIYVDAAGNLFIADTGNNAVREVSPGGIISTIAGGSAAVVCATKTDTVGDGCPAANSTLLAPSDVWGDAAGNLYILDAGDFRVRKINATTGVITSVVGNGSKSASTTTVGDGSLGTAATLGPGASGLVVDSLGDIFIADTGNFRIREVNAAGIISTVAGNGVTGAAGDGLGALVANLASPTGVTLDASENVYIADTQNSRIRVVNVSSGALSLFTSTITGSTGTASATQTVNVYNEGTGALTITSFAFSGPFSEKTGASSECKPAGSLAPGASCIITVAYTPTAAGESTGTLTLFTNAANAPATGAVVQLAGVATVLTSPAATFNTTTVLTTNLPVPPVISPTTSFTLNVTVTGAAGSVIIPTGQVLFVSGTTSLGTATLTPGVLNNQAVATLTVNGLPAGLQNLTATYLGDGNYKTSAATVIQIGVFNGKQDFGVSTTTAGITLSSATPSAATALVSAYSINGYATVVSFTCTNLPAPLLCAGTPYTTYVAPGRQSAPAVILTFTNPSPLSQLDRRNGRWNALSGITFALTLMGGLALRRKHRVKLLSIFLLAAGLSGLLSLSGCSTGVPNTIAPGGTYQVVVTGSDGTYSHSITIPLTIQ